MAELDKIIYEGKRSGVDVAKWLIDKVVAMNSRRKNVVNIPDENVVFVGDLHGELDCISAIAEKYVLDGSWHVVFLGDYGDRGPLQVETFNTVMALAIKYRDRVTMLRGNHESTYVAQKYGFYDAVTNAYSRDFFKEYDRVFKSLPIAASSSKGIFCCHGGVPENVKSIYDIIALDRFSWDIEPGIIFQLLWNDPVEDDTTFTPCIRGGDARYYGRRAFEAFRKNLGIEVMIRAHQVFENGYKRFFDGRLHSIFSCTAGGRVSPSVFVIEDNIDGRPEKFLR